MATEPLVSVIVPVYNVERYLPECLDSICGQSYPNLEILLVDDGATDSSGLICERYAAQDSRIQVIHQENQGAAIAKNTGLDAASGEFVWMVDADDYLDPGALALLLQQQRESNADVVVFGFSSAFANGIRKEEMVHQPGLIQAKDYLAQFPYDWTCSLFWNKLFHRTCIGNIRFQKKRRCIDDEFFTYRIFFNAKNVKIIDADLYFYRQRRGSVTKNSRNDRQRSQDALDGMEQRYQDILRTYPELERGFLDHQFHMLVYMTHAFYMDESILPQVKQQLRRKLLRAARHRLDKGELLAAFRILCTPDHLLLKKNTYGNRNEDTATGLYFD